AGSIYIPAGSTLTQWVYLQGGLLAPFELTLQLEAVNANNSTGWAHRSHWGYQINDFGCSYSLCGIADRGVGPLPTAGRWVALIVNLGPAEGANPSSDVGMAGHELTGIAFGAFGGAAAVWWGPTLLQLPGGAVNDPTRAIST